MAGSAGRVGVAGSAGASSAAPNSTTPGAAPERAAPTLAEALDATRRASIRTAVTAAEGNWAAAARALGVDRANLHRLARRLGLK